MSLPKSAGGTKTARARPSVMEASRLHAETAAVTASVTAAMLAEMRRALDADTMNHADIEDCLTDFARLWQAKQGPPTSVARVLSSIQLPADRDALGATDPSATRVGGSSALAAAFALDRDSEFDMDPTTLLPGGSASASAAAVRLPQTDGPGLEPPVRERVVRTIAARHRF